jgi:glyoxylase-like metal-dependent hydrolase (beta-lactamase superfamily II)
MEWLAEDLQLVGGGLPWTFNVYLMGDVLVDAGSRQSARRILRQVGGQGLRAHALTHVHPDHQGASHRVCTERGLPLWCGEADAPAMEDGQIARRQPDHFMNRFSERTWAGPPHPVARRLREGDEVGGFTVLEVPGHTAGHVAFWRELDRTLVLGDVLTNMSMYTGARGLHEPPRFFSQDPQRNRDAARRVAALEPELVCFGHGPPLRDPRRLGEFVATLPA